MRFKDINLGFWEMNVVPGGFLQFPDILTKHIIAEQLVKKIISNPTWYIRLIKL